MRGAGERGQVVRRTSYPAERPSDRHLQVGGSPLEAAQQAREPPMLEIPEPELQAKARLKHALMSSISSRHTECCIPYACHASVYPSDSSRSRDCSARSIGMTWSVSP